MRIGIEVFDTNGVCLASLTVPNDEGLTIYIGQEEHPSDAVVRVDRLNTVAPRRTF